MMKWSEIVLSLECDSLPGDSTLDWNKPSFDELITAEQSAALGENFETTELYEWLPTGALHLVISVSLVPDEFVFLRY
jgi:hypothetical protein